MTLGSQISIANAINSVVSPSDTAGASSHVMSAIKKAAYTTGVDFSYLVKKASQESSFDPSAKATTSSATGLFQFTSQTWLHMIKEYGADHGLGEYAAQITKNSDGSLRVANASAKQAILALRKDPSVSAVMAGELDKENAAYLEKKVGGKIGATELYLAHFLGANGASKFIKEMRANPTASAASVLPSAAAANDSIFYAKSGEARSLQQIYTKFAQKFDNSSTRLASAAKGTTPDSSTIATTALSSKIASFMPSDTAATQTSDVAQTLQSQKAASLSVVSATPKTASTLFDAMMFGQIQGKGLGTPSALSSYSQTADEKKKQGYSLVS
ncbi:MAG: transglycosylase SLT domain-containing protein [Alphaproteobacteria bacterium]|nr:transglycosylase SLT domain-containing protein [Alphaproteobacteria bacterium]